MNYSGQQLYLMSSNASEKYATDIIETIASPQGFVHHFRYRMKWLDPDLRKTIKLQNCPLRDLNSMKVVICYLYQSDKEGKREWRHVYPVRLGTLVEAYKSGQDDEDIAHFYFKSGAYVFYTGQDGNKITKDALGNKYGNSFAAFGKSLDDIFIAQPQDSKTAFRSICTSLVPDHFQTPEGKRLYHVFCSVEGVKSKGGKLLTPKYEAASRKSYYELQEGTCYHFQFGLRCPEQTSEFSFNLTSDEKIFSTPSKYELRVSSPYDEESWLLVSKLLETDTWSSITFLSNIHVTDQITLNPMLTFPILIKRKIAYRIIEVCGDIGFGVGTLSLALRAALEQWSWWYWPVILGYSLWGISKFLVKFWRG